MLRRALIAVTSLMLIAGCTLARTPTKTYRAISDINIQVGQNLPKFTLPSGDGSSQITSDNFLGKVTVISFFTEGCHPCIHEIPVLNSFKAANPQYNVVAISPDPIKYVATYQKKYNFTWPIVGDGETYVFETLGVKAFPSFAIIDSHGTLLGTTYGNQLGDDAYVSKKGLSAWVEATIKAKVLKTRHN